MKERRPLVAGLQQTPVDRKVEEAFVFANKPTPPPEVANWVIYPTPPEVLEEMLQSFDEEEFMAELREVEQTGGVSGEEIIAEIEAMVKRRD